MCKAVSLGWKLQFLFKVAPFILFFTPYSYFLEDRNLRSADAACHCQELYGFIVNVPGYVAEDLRKHRRRMNE